MHTTHHGTQTDLGWPRRAPAHGSAQGAAGVNCQTGRSRAGPVTRGWMCSVLGEASCMTSRRVTLPRAMNQCSNPRLAPKSGSLCVVTVLCSDLLCSLREPGAHGP